MTRTALVTLILIGLSSIASARPMCFERVSLTWEMPDAPTRRVTIQDGRVRTSRTAAAGLSLSTEEVATNMEQLSVDVALRRVPQRGRRKVEGSGSYGTLQVEFRDGSRLELAAPWEEWRQHPWLAATARRILELERKASRREAWSRYVKALEAQAQLASQELAQGGGAKLALAKEVASTSRWGKIEFASLGQLGDFLESFDTEAAARLLETLKAHRAKARQAVAPLGDELQIELSHERVTRRPSYFAMREAKVFAAALEGATRARPGIAASLR